MLIFHKILKVFMWKEILSYNRIISSIKDILLLTSTVNNVCKVARVPKVNNFGFSGNTIARATQYSGTEKKWTSAVCVCISTSAAKTKVN